MTDKIPLFKEEINNIPVPIEKLDDIILKTVQTNERNSKHSIQKKIIYSFCTVAVVFVLLVGSATISPVMAIIISKIPIIGTVFSQSGDVGLERVQVQGLTNEIGTTKSFGGTSITLDEVFYDETRLTIGFSIMSENPIEEFYLSEPNITINGKGFSNASTYYEKEISPTYRTGIINIDSFDNLPDSFILGVTFTSADDKQWDFSTSVHMKSIVQKVVIDHTQKVEGIELSIPDLKVGPGGLQIAFSANSEQINYFSNGYIDFKVIDDKGNELKSHSGKSQIETIDNKAHYTGTRLFDPINENVKVLTITPYIKYQQGGSSVEVGLEGNEKITEIKPFKGPDIKFDSFTMPLP